MSKSYLVKSSVNFADFGFFVKAGDILVHNPTNSNQLTVYRNGQVVKTMQQTTLGIAAFVKNGFIEDVTSQAKVAPKAPQKPVEAPKPAVKAADPKPRPAPAASVPTPQKPKQEEIEQKRKKAVPTEVNIDDVPRLKEALEKYGTPKAKAAEIEEE